MQAILTGARILNDPFDILEVRRKLMEAVGGDRRPPRRAAASPYEPRGPSLFEWTDVETLVLEDEAPPPAPDPIDPDSFADAALRADLDWPPISDAPLSGADRARPFGRRGDDTRADVLDLVEPVARMARSSASARLKPAPEVEFAFDDYARPEPVRTAAHRRILDEIYEVPDLPPEIEAGEVATAAPDLVDPAPPVDEATRRPEPQADDLITVEFEDVITTEALEAQERAAEARRRLFVAREPHRTAVRTPGEKLLLGLANSLLLERDRLEARLSDVRAPPPQTVFRRRRGERDHVDLSTANDRG